MVGCTEFIKMRDKARLMDFTLKFAQGSQGLPFTKIQSNKAKEKKNRAWTSEDHEKFNCSGIIHMCKTILSNAKSESSIHRKY